MLRVGLRKKDGKSLKILGEIKLNIGNVNLELITKLINDVPHFQKGKKREIFPEKMRKTILKKYNNTCALCGRDEDIDIHHIHPQGKAISSNGVPLCAMCHYIVHCYLREFRGYKWVPHWEERFGQFHEQLAMHMTTVAYELKIMRGEIQKLKKGQGHKKDYRDFDSFEEYREYWKNQYFPGSNKKSL